MINKYRVVQNGLGEISVEHSKPSYGFKAAYTSELRGQNQSVLTPSTEMMWEHVAVFKTFESAKTWIETQLEVETKMIEDEVKRNSKTVLWSSDGQS